MMKIYIDFKEYFSHVQEAPWYHEFLSSVVHQIETKSKVLDVGTGAGKLLQLLYKEKHCECTGIEVNESMLKQAERKLYGLPVKLLKIQPGTEFPLQNNYYDVVCICNVLFTMNSDNRHALLQQSLRTLKPGGKLIILTPTGRGTFKNFSKYYFDIKNAGFGLWYVLTRISARYWYKNNYLDGFSVQNNLLYSRKMVFDGFGLLEILKKK